MVVYDSSAWVKTSIPVEAVTSGGMLTVSRGSTRAMVGLRYGWEIPDFTFRSRMSIIADGVDSLAVPAVVGMKSDGFSGPGTALASPMGLLI